MTGLEGHLSKPNLKNIAKTLASLTLPSIKYMTLVTLSGPINFLTVLF
jgi:hypothetical protein